MSDTLRVLLNYNSCWWLTNICTHICINVYTYMCCEVYLSYLLPQNDLWYWSTLNIRSFKTFTHVVFVCVTFTVTLVLYTFTSCGLRVLLHTAERRIRVCRLSTSTLAPLQSSSWTLRGALLPAARCLCVCSGCSLSPAPSLPPSPLARCWLQPQWRRP